MIKVEKVNGEDYIRLADIRATVVDFRTLWKLFTEVSTPPIDPPVDPDPVDPPDDPDPVDPPEDPDPVDPPEPAIPWRDIARDGQPTAAGWYTTLMPTDGDDAAYAHYWDGTQWLWAPTWFPTPFGNTVEPGMRYVGPVEAGPTTLLQGIAR